MKTSQERPGHPGGNALKHEKVRLQKTGTTSWFEPMMEIIRALELAGKAVEAKSPDEIAPLVQKIGLNLLISRKKVSFELAPPFDFASHFLAETRVSSDSRPVPQLATLGTRTIWCPGQDSNLQAFRQRLLRPSCLPVPPPERSTHEVIRHMIAPVKSGGHGGDGTVCDRPISARRRPGAASQFRTARSPR